MTSRDFAYWLQGYFEINGLNGGLTQKQTVMIARHLALVFKHEIDPSVGGDAAELQGIHDGVTSVDDEPPSHYEAASGSDIFHRPPVVRC